MKNSNILPVIATPVANSNNEALLVPAAAVGVKPKAKVKKAAEMSRTACFNEITRTAHRIFVKNTPRKICSLLKEDQLCQLKRDAISEAIVMYQTKHGGDYDLKVYKKDFFKRVYLLVNNPIFRNWCDDVDCCPEPEKAAQHIVFNGAEFFERVMMNDYLEHGELQIGWHRDYDFDIFDVSHLEWNEETNAFDFRKPEGDKSKGKKPEAQKPEAQKPEDQKPEDQKDNAPKAPKGEAKDANAKE